MAYFGGKSGSGTYQTIINQIPPHHTYVEGFAGMCGVFRKKLPAKDSVLIEVDQNVIMRLVDAGIDTALIHQGCALDILDNFRSHLDRIGVFIYLDPPYPHLTRKSATRYPFEMSDSKHEVLLMLIRSYRHAMIAISTYPNELYSSMLQTWRMIEFEAQTRRGTSTEQLFMNYPEPGELHDYRYLGTDYRERERITRKLNRWQAKFAELAPLEQKAMIQRLANT